MFVLPMLFVAGHAAVPAAPVPGAFLNKQMAYSRVRAARPRIAELRSTFEKARLTFPPRGLFIRIFKRERQVEVWVPEKGGTHKRLKTYPICAASGGPGPKRQQGDLQVPEGFYHLSRFNPVSSYHLSLKVSYPNRSDRIRGVKGDLGGDIYLHGDCVSIGCVAIEDRAIEELYLLAAMARSHQKRIPIHIFPHRFAKDGPPTSLSSELTRFWRELYEPYLAFERDRRVPRVCVAKDGRYLTAAKCR